MCAPRANFTLSVLFDKYNSPYSEIPFEFQSSGVTLKLYYAIYNSIYPHVTEFEKKHGSQVAMIDTFSLAGSYTYFHSVSSENTDSIKIHIICSDPTLILHGHFIYYFLSLKQNYFGKYSQVYALEDFVEPAQKTMETSEEEQAEHNAFEFYFLWDINSFKLQLPVGLYASEQRELVHISQFMVEARLTTYYLDFYVNIYPIILKTTATDSFPSKSSSKPSFFSISSIYHLE